MKKIAMISTFCDTEEKQNVLIENINTLKNNNVDVLCISPNSIKLSDDIIKKSDFVFYTKENPLLGWPERAFTFWKTILTDKGWLKMTHFLNDYGWAALYQTKKLMQIALSYDYDIFYHLIYDTDIDDIVLSEINNNEVNIVHPRVNPNNENEIWETTLHFMIFDRDLLKEIVEDITLEEYLRTNGVAEGEVFKWKNKYNIKSSEHPVKDKIFLYKDKDFFNYSNSEDYKLFINKHDSHVNIWKGDPPEKVLMDDKLRIILYELKNYSEILINVNDNIKNITLNKGDNKIIEFEIKCNDIEKIIITCNGVDEDLTEKYKNLNRSYISYQ